MERRLLADLSIWLKSYERKPLILRGAPQVGKTWLVRHFAEQSGLELIEINFERNASYSSLFDANNPEQILVNLSTLTQKKISPAASLLFLDEIQLAPQMLSKLRWFAEDLPQLAVIAAGSLLEFSLAQHSLSLPVGQITYRHLEPLSFEEFLLAQEKHVLCDYLQNITLEDPLPLNIHEQYLASFKDYLLIGGMPACVDQWCKEPAPMPIYQRQNDLLATYRNDFTKYKVRTNPERLDNVMMAIPKMLGKKFVFSQVKKTLQAATIKHILKLLEKARLCHRVQSTSANRVPLDADIQEKWFKEIFLDVGLCSAALGLPLNPFTTLDDLLLINQSALANQVVGQLLRTITPAYKEPALFCWQRDETGSSAEIDYIIQHG
ncbi:MAG: AAA family ATPase, partial [Silvanigrellaceae bacterium]|nr:AAA family ATPase [Silvanigrellaceae bacterium]